MNQNEPNTPLTKAKATLLRALDQLEGAETDLEQPPDRVDLIVVYSIGREDPDDHGAYHEVGGWASTAGPKWMFAKLLERAADSFDTSAYAQDDDPDEDQDEDED